MGNGQFYFKRNTLTQSTSAQHGGVNIINACPLVFLKIKDARFFGPLNGRAQLLLKMRVSFMGEGDVFSVKK